MEIKSLNSKALDLSARIVPLYREKEMEIRAMISRTLERGKVDFTIWVEKDDTQTATPINGVILDNYYQQIKQISEERHIPLPADWFATLLRLPDVMTRTEVEELDEEEWTAVRTAIEEAIGKLVDFRKQEGAALQKKFTEKIQNIGDLLKSIEPYEQKAAPNASANVWWKPWKRFPMWITTRTAWNRNLSTTSRNSISTKRNNVWPTT